MGMTRQLVYVKKKKGAGSSSQKKRGGAFSAPSRKSVTASREPEFDLSRASAVHVPRTAEKEPNWYLRFVVSLSVIGVAALVWIRSDLGLMAWESLKSLPSPYSATAGWRGQDARYSGLEREAATKRPPPSEESFLATFRGRASSPN